jgi:hypothetical protein
LELYYFEEFDFEENFREKNDLEFGYIYLDKIFADVGFGSFNINY